MANDVDLEAPVLESFTVTPNIVDGEEGAIVTAELVITDETGLKDLPEVTIFNAAGNLYGPATTSAVGDPGDKTDATYEATIEIPVSAYGQQPLGEWEVALAPLSDTLNNVGEGASETFTYAVAPDAPATVEVSSAIISQISASWDAPEPNGSPVVKYVGSIRNAEGAEVSSFATETVNCDSCELTTLLEEGTYTLSIAAENAAGVSAWSDAVEFQVEAADLSATPTPTVSGPLYVGETLTADAGVWGPEPVELSYQWFRGDTSIVGATSSTYETVAEDEGAVMTVSVTGTKDGYNTTTVISDPTDVIAPADVVAPEVSVSLEAGKHLYGSDIELSANEDAKIYYTIDGSAPTEESTLYETPIAIEGWFELKYFAVDGAGNASVTQSATYTLDFTDVFEGTDEKPGTMYYEAIQWAVEAGITNGYKKDGVFKPYTPISRDAMAAFMYRLAGEPEFDAPEVSPFVDYDSNNQFYKEVTWLEANDISNGWTVDETENTAEYRPFEPINRDAMAAFVYRFAALEGDRFDGPTGEFEGPAESYFADYDDDNKFYDEVSWLYEQEITTGWTVGESKEYRPYTPINRDAMAVFLQRLAEGEPAEEAPQTEIDGNVEAGDK
ncbi:chitobiase/beta-hexosaminidase C-terminal domain-containing protein [Arthrobacter monumenti]